jgi:hypothetical protein
MTLVGEHNDRMVQLIWGTAFVGLFFLANVLWWRATKRLAPGENRLRVYFWTGLFARRKSFTTQGWRYRNWTVVALLALLLLAVMNPAL